MDLEINGTELVANIASTSASMLTQLSPLIWLLGGVLFAFFIAIQILDTMDYNRVMKNARATSDETDRLLDG